MSTLRDQLNDVLIRNPSVSTGGVRALLDELMPIITVHVMEQIDEQQELIAKAIEDRPFVVVEGRYTMTHPMVNCARLLRLTNNDCAHLVRYFGKEEA